MHYILFVFEPWKSISFVATGSPRHAPFPPPPSPAIMQCTRTTFEASHICNMNVERCLKAGLRPGYWDRLLCVALQGHKDAGRGVYERKDRESTCCSSHLSSPAIAAAKAFCGAHDAYWLQTRSSHSSHFCACRTSSRGEARLVDGNKSQLYCRLRSAGSTRSPPSPPAPAEYKPGGRKHTVKMNLYWTCCGVDIAFSVQMRSSRCSQACRFQDRLLR